MGGMSIETHWTFDPVVMSSLELFQVMEEASNGRTTTKKPLFQSSQFPVLFLNVLGLTLLSSTKEMAL